MSRTRNEEGSPYWSWSRESGSVKAAGAASGTRCPQILGIDEHFFSRHGYATTFCDLKVHDVVLGRSEASLEDYLHQLEGKSRVKVVCMDLAQSYRALVQHHFPQARIVAGRFHVIRLVNHHFLACWKLIDPVGAKNRGFLKLMCRPRHTLPPEQQHRLSEYLRQHPLLELWRFTRNNGITEGFHTKMEVLQ